MCLRVLLHVCCYMLHVAVVHDLLSCSFLNLCALLEPRACVPRGVPCRLSGAASCRGFPARGTSDSMFFTVRPCLLKGLATFPATCAPTAARRASNAATRRLAAAMHTPLTHAARRLSAPAPATHARSGATNARPHGDSSCRTPPTHRPLAIASALLRGPSGRASPTRPHGPAPRFLYRVSGSGFKRSRGFIRGLQGLYIVYRV